MKIRRRLGLVAFAAWLAILVTVFAYAVRPDQHEGAKQNSPVSRPRPSTVPRDATPGSSVVSVDPGQPDPAAEAAADAEVLGAVQPFTGYSLFRPRSAPAPAPPAFVLPDFSSFYLGPGFIYTGPVVTSPAPTTGGTAGPPPTRPPTPTTGPTTTRPPPTTTTPPTDPPVTEPPTTEPPTTEPPPPPDTVPPETTPDP